MFWIRELILKRLLTKQTFSVGPKYQRYDVKYKHLKLVIYDVLLLLYRKKQIEPIYSNQNLLWVWVSSLLSVLYDQCFQCSVEGQNYARYNMPHWWRDKSLPDN